MTVCACTGECRRPGGRCPVAPWLPPSFRPFQMPGHHPRRIAHDGWQCPNGKVNDLPAEIAAVCRERDALKEILVWYANRENYDFEGRLLVNCKTPRHQAALCDLGYKASETLAKLKSGELRK